MDIDDVLYAFGAYDDEDYEIEEYDMYEELFPYLCVVIYPNEEGSYEELIWEVCTTDDVDQMIRFGCKKFKLMTSKHIKGFKKEILEYYKVQKQFLGMKTHRQITKGLDPDCDLTEIDKKIQAHLDKFITLRNELEKKINYKRNAFDRRKHLLIGYY